MNIRISPMPMSSIIDSTVHLLIDYIKHLQMFRTDKSWSGLTDIQFLNSRDSDMNVEKGK